MVEFFILCLLVVPLGLWWLGMRLDSCIPDDKELFGPDGDRRGTT